MSTCKDFARKAKHRIAIQSYSETVDDFGSPVQTWSTDTTVWAYIKPLNGNERFIHEKLEAKATHMFTIRYLSSIEAAVEYEDKRILWDSRVFNIRHVKNVDTLNQFMEVIAEENVDT